MRKLNLPARMENFEALLNFILQEAAREGFEKSVLGKIRLACEEIIVNVINYAYKTSTGDIEILTDTGLTHKKLRIEIRDHGVSFNPLKMSEPVIDAPVHERKIGGLGIYLVRKVMDKVKYKRKGDMNIIILVKYKNRKPGKNNPKKLNQ